MSDELRRRATEYLVAYDDYQVAFARARLTGYTGDPKTLPSELAISYGAMIRRLGELRNALGMLAFNYVTTAQQQLEKEANESRRKAEDEKNG